MRMDVAAPAAAPAHVADLGGGIEEKVAEPSMAARWARRRLSGGEHPTAAPGIENLGRRDAGQVELDGQRSANQPRIAARDVVPTSSFPI